MDWKHPLTWIGIIGAALAIKIVAESLALFSECITCSAHTLTECAIIGLLY